MGFLAFLILGLIAGAIATAPLPGRQAGEPLTTLVHGAVTGRRARRRGVARHPRAATASHTTTGIRRDVRDSYRA